MIRGMFPSEGYTAVDAIGILASLAHPTTSFCSDYHNRAAGVSRGLIRGQINVG